MNFFICHSIVLNSITRQKCTAFQFKFISSFARNATRMSRAEDAHKLINLNSFRFLFRVTTNRWRFVSTVLSFSCALLVACHRISANWTLSGPSARCAKTVYSIERTDTWKKCRKSNSKLTETKLRERWKHSIRRISTFSMLMTSSNIGAWPWQRNA